MAQRVIVIGAGPGGLAAAALLAKAGLSVTLFEKEQVVGGRNAAMVADGYRFDVGPTFFLYPEVLEEIFEAVGRQLSEAVEMVKLDPQYRIVFGAGGQLDCTPDLDAMVQRVSALSPADGPAFRRFIEQNRRKFALAKPCLQMPYEGLRDLLRLRMIKLLPMLRPWQSLDGYLGGFFQDPRIRLALSFQSKYLGMSPFQCPSLFSILSYMEYDYGVWHPIGGCNQLSAKLAEVAQELGVELRLGEAVEEMLLDGRRAVGVRTATGEHRADAVVLNADFAHAMSTLVPNTARRRWTDQRLATKRYSCSTFMLYLGIEGTFDDLAHHTIYVAEDYVQNLKEIEQQHVLSEQPSFYVQNACRTDPTLAPAGHSTLYVLVPVTHRHPNVDWAVERQRYRDLVLAQLANVGVTDLESRIRFERVITPADWEASGVYRGATFNLAHNLGQMLNFRPHNRFEDLAGTYLVGGGTHPGSGLPVIFESARLSSRLLLQDLGADPVTA